MDASGDCFESDQLFGVSQRDLAALSTVVCKENFTMLWAMSAVVCKELILQCCGP